jgi:hypothetical protein
MAEFVCPTAVFGIGNVDCLVYLAEDAEAQGGS